MSRKNTIRITAIILFSALAALIMIYNVVVGIVAFPGGDFLLRYNEAECLRSGVDPYDVVSKKVESDKYALWGTPEMDRPGMNAIHVYPPWEYTWFLPFTFLDRKTGGALFLELAVLALAGIGVYAYLAGTRLRGDPWDGVLCASAALFLGRSGGEVLYFANFGSFNALLIILLILLLKTKHDILAGLAWGLLMTKPQIGLLFAIPLLIKRRFVTMASAAIFCALSTIPAAVLCHRNPVEMILEVPRANMFLMFENGTMLIPQQVSMALSDRISGSTLNTINMLVGGGICLLLTWRMRNSKSWLLILCPAIVCSLLWTYCKPHDRVILWVLEFGLTVLFIRSRDWRVRAACIVLILLTAWPWFWGFKVGGVAKLVRRVSLLALLVCCWIAPKIKLIQDIEEDKS